MAKTKRELVDEESYVSQTPPMNDPSNWIPTGSLALDAAVGGMGIPKGHITEVYGPSQSRKSSLALLMVAMAQKRPDVRACWYAGEDGIPEGVADLAGTDLLELRYKHIATVEELFMRAGNFSRKAQEDGVSPLWVIDSLSSLSCDAEVWARAGQKFTRPPQAIAITKGWRMGSHTLRKTKATAIIISHEKGGWVPGGRATGFYSSVRIFTRLVPQTAEDIKNDVFPHEIKNIHGEDVGVRLIVDVAKTRFGPLKRIPVNFYYDRGFPIDPIDDMWSFLKTQGIVRTSGSWQSMKPHIQKSFYSKDFPELYQKKGKDFWDEMVQNFRTKRYASICEKRGITPEQHEEMYAKFLEKEKAFVEQELNEIMDDPEKRAIIEENGALPAVEDDSKKK